MQPFEKHPAVPAELEAYGDQLIAEGSQALQLGASTRAAYQPAASAVTGVPAPAVAAAPIPVDEASAATSGALVWGAVATKYWGKQVGEFNAKVDQIVAQLRQAETDARNAASAAAAAPGPDGAPAGPTAPGADPQPALDAALTAARARWVQAHEEHIVAGQAQAASMLQQGPTGANQQIARAAGVMPEMEWGFPMQLLNKSGARFLLVQPHGQGPAAGAFYATERVLNALSYIDKGWYAARMNFYPQGFTQPVPPGSQRALGLRIPARPGVFAPGTTIPQKLALYQDRANWQLKPGVPLSAGATRDFLNTTARVAKPFGAAVSGASGAVDQWTRDAGRTDIGTGERVVRSGYRGGLNAAGSLAGAWGGAKIGAGLGLLIGGPAGAAIGGIGGAIIGGIAGSAISNEIADETLYPSGEPQPDNGVDLSDPYRPGIGGV